MAKVRIVIAEDHTMVRQGFRRILEAQPDWEVVAEAGDGREAVAQTVASHADVLILDIGMPLLNGIESARQVTRKMPHVGVLIVSMHAEDTYVMRALEAGARGYLLKDSADVDLVSGVKAVAAGKSYFSPLVSRMMLDEHIRSRADKGLADRYDSLSEREREVFQLIAEGQTNKNIAEMLSLSVATVETHRSHVLQKLDVHNTAELVLYAVRRGVVS